MTTILPPDQSAPADEPDPSKGTGRQASTVEPVDAVVDGATRKQVQREQFAVLYKSPGFIIGALIFAFWVLSSIFPGLLSTIDPKALSLSLIHI